MRAAFIPLIFFCSVFSTFSQNSPNGGIYTLPDLEVFTNSTYLLRNTPTRLECRVTTLKQRSETTLDRIYWMKDGALISELALKHDELMESKGILTISRATHFAEGEYQCSAIVRNIQLAADTRVDSRLVSAPVKLRRARITKFERYSSEAVVVRAGEVARIPCYGIPDVVPGPPDIWFEKQGNEGVQLGRTGNQRFVSTPTGLQIALTQPGDAGRYYCMVRNTFMNLTRAAPKPVVLKVEAAEKYRRPPELRRPRLVYPLVANQSQPIEYHVVAGETAVLECVMADATIRWTKPTGALPDVSIDNDRSRIRQLWGNLRIKQVTVEDSDDYVCHGLREYGDAALREPQHPRVIYRLVVHAPTSVRLLLGQQPSDKSWQLSCYAQNLWYEIPMVYVNGLALIDAMTEMGVPAQTNFYMNPINVTLKATNPLSGSVQCISRPAMEEAEIYGPGLDRGRSMNLYVDQRLNAAPQLIVQSPQNSSRAVGDRVRLACVPLGVSGVSLRWLKDGKFLDTNAEKRIRLVGAGSLEISALKEADSGSYVCEVSKGTHSNKATATLTVRTAEEERQVAEKTQINEASDLKSKSDNGAQKGGNYLLESRRPTPTRSTTIKPPKPSEEEIFDSDEEEDDEAEDEDENYADLTIPTSPPSPPPTQTTEMAKSPILEAFELTRPVVFIDSNGNARVQWSVAPIAATTRHQFLREFAVEFRQIDAAAPTAATTAEERDASPLWTESERVPAHVRATTLRSLSLSSKYQFRVVAWFGGGFSEIQSPATDWLAVAAAMPRQNLTIPLAPRITRLQTISSTSLLVAWEHTIGSRWNVADRFVVLCRELATDETVELKVHNATREMLVTELSPDAEYRVSVFAENDAGRSLPSQSRIARTYVNVHDGIGGRLVDEHGATLLLLMALVALAIPCFCIMAICSIRKYLEFSRIPMEEKQQLPTPQSDAFVRRNQFYQDPAFLNGDPLNELAPLNFQEPSPNADPLPLYVEKPFAQIRENGRSDLQRGVSQMSLNNVHTIGFKRPPARRPDLSGLYSLSPALTGSAFINKLADEEFAHRITAGSRSGFRPVQRAPSTPHRQRSPSATRSALNIFTSIGPLPSLNPDPMAIPRPPLNRQRSNGSSPDQPPTTTTTVSPNGSPGSVSGGGDRLPPPLPNPHSVMRSATSSVELSSFRALPSSGMRTFGDPTSHLSRSQLHQGGYNF